MFTTVPVSQKLFLTMKKMGCSDNNFPTAKPFGCMHPREGKNNQTILIHHDAEHIDLLGLIPITEQYSRPIDLNF